MKKWNVTGEALIGLSHKSDNTPGQDKLEIYAPEKNPNGVIAAALADGVGSLKYSHIAAKLATVAAVAWVRENIDRVFDGLLEDDSKREERSKLLREEMLMKIRGVIREQAERQGMDIKSMDCNLAFILIDPVRNKALVGQLGDCAVCIICDDSGKRQSQVISDRGGLANSTCTVFSSTAVERMRLGVLSLDNPMLQGFILTSDGMDGVIYRKNSKYVCKQAEYCFNAVYNKKDNAALRKLLEDAQDNSDGYLDDDMSVVVLSRAEKPVTLAEDLYWTCDCGARNSLAGSRCIDCHKDMTEVYRNVDFSRYDSLDIYFEEENARRKREELRLKEAAARVNVRVGNTGEDKKKERPEDITTDDTEESNTNDSGGSVPLPRGRNQRARREEKKPREISLGAMGEKASKRQEEDEVKTEIIGGKDGDKKKVQSRVLNGNLNGHQTKGNEEEDRIGDFGFKILMFVICCAMVAIILLIFKDRFFSEKVPEGSGTGRPPVVQTTAPVETSKQTEPTGVPKTTEPVSGSEPSTPIGAMLPEALEGNVLELSDGSVYIGESVDGVPHGFGTIIDGDTQWIGVFDHGIKNGVFSLVTNTDGKVIYSVVLCRDDLIDATLYENEGRETEETYCLTRELKALRPRPGYGIRGKEVSLKKGDRVYLTDTLPVTVDGETWIEIETEDGDIGWCEENAVTKVVGGIDIGNILG